MGELEHISNILERTGLYEAREDSLLQAELAAYAEGLELYFGELETMLRECFISTAETYGLTLREQLMRHGGFDSTLEGRRNALLKGASVGSGDFTEAGMTKVLESFGLTGSFTFSPQQPLLTLRTPQTMTTARRDRLLEELRPLMPCWVELAIETGVT